MGETADRRARIAWAAALAVIVGVAAVLRWRGLTAQGLWVDEGLSLHIARTPLDSLLAELASREQTPPLFHLILKGWIGLFGESDLAVRALPALLGIAAVPAMTRMLSFAGRPAALAAAGLLAVNPFHITYSQEARCYSLLVLLAIVSCWCMFRLLRRWTLLDAVVYAVATSLLLYTHLYAVFIIMAQNLAYVMHGLWRELDWRRWLAAQAAVALAVAPFVPTIARWVAGVSKSFWIEPNQFGLTGTYFALSGSWLLLAGLTLAAAVALGLRRGWRDGRLMLLAWLVVLPVAIPVLVSALTRPLFVDRYAIAALAGMCGLAGVGVMRLGRTAGSGVLLIMLALSVRAAVTSPPPEWRLPWRELAGEVNAAAEPGDVVLVSQPYQTSPVILHYLTANVGVAELPVNDAAAAIGRWRSQGNSVWIIARSGEAPRVLAAAGRPRRLWQQPGLDLLYYDAPW